jgi:hypothetical protein
MMNKFFGFNFDFAGAITASLCAVHCTVFPILLSLGFTSTSTHNHTFDFAMMSLGVLIAGYSLVRDYMKTHKNPQPLFLALAGFVILFIGIETHGDFFLLNIIGGLMVVGSHLLNWRLSHSKLLVKS